MSKAYEERQQLAAENSTEQKIHRQISIDYDASHTYGITHGRTLRI